VTSAFVREGTALVEWIDAYLREVEHLPVRAQVAPGAIAAALPPEAPRTAEPLGAILADARDRLTPGITHWNHPAFFAYFAISAPPAGILAELLAAAWNVNAMLWTTSPAATELEIVVVRWLAALLGLPTDRFGMLTDTASTSTLLALAAARERDPALAVREHGLAGRADLPVLRVYCSAHAHSSVDKAAMLLGLGRRNVVRIAVDDAHRLCPARLATAVAADRAAGHRPLAVVATVGTTSVASVDPVPAIADVCAREGLWLHVDASYAGSAAVAEEFRWCLDGADHADSIVVNPHKWLFTPVGVSALWLRDAEALRRACALVPEYLTTATDGVTDFMDYHYQLGKPFRALKLWMVIRAFGADGLAARIREQVRLARGFAAWVAADPAWTVAAPVDFSLVCFRWAPAALDGAAQDAANRRILERVNAGGAAYLSHTVVDDRTVLRCAIGNVATEERHLRVAWDALRAAAAAEPVP
jgi:aromatic-L-amino-acid decarboxylase